MHKLIICLIICVLASAAMAVAQAPTPDASKFEIFAGYNYQRVTREKLSEIVVFDGIRAPISGFREDDFRNTFGAGTNLNGFTISGTYYATRRFGITGEFSLATGSGSRDVRQVATVPGDTVHIKRTKYDFMVGPQIKYKGETRLEPFARVLLGVSRQRNHSRFLTNNIEADRLEDEFTSFSASFDGGLDIRIKPRFAVRLFQVEYNPVFTKERNVFLASSFPGDETIFGGTRRDNFRFSAGIVFR